MNRLGGSASFFCLRHFSLHPSGLCRGLDSILRSTLLPRNLLTVPPRRPGANDVLSNEENRRDPGRGGHGIFPLRKLTRRIKVERDSGSPARVNLPSAVITFPSLLAKFSSLVSLRNSLPYLICKFYCLRCPSWYVKQP